MENLSPGLHQNSSQLEQITAGESFHWRAHPARERVKIAMLGGFIILSLGIIIFTSFQSILLTLFSIFVLVLQLNRFYFPSSFSINSQGISAKYLLRSQRMNWSKIKRIEQDNYGAYLSKREIPSRWDAFRGMQILFGNEREKVKSLLKMGWKSAS
ncbi:MAG: hypothetical protein ACE5EE_06710 [Fidelibacterota bacterium]